MLARLLWYVMCLAGASLICGCGAPSKALYAERYFWPPLPDRPRIEWLHSYNSQLDLEKTPYQIFKEKLVGADQAIPLVKPVDVLSDPERGRMFVSDIGARRVYVFDLKKSELRFLTVPEMNPPLAISSPLGLAMDRSGNVYLLERRNNIILIFDHDEKYVRAIPLDTITKKPIALAVDKKLDRLLVADAESHCIHVLDLNGVRLFKFGRGGIGDGEFNLPLSITVTSKDDIVVADVFNARVQIFDSQGRFKNMFGSRGDGLADFQLIKSVAVDSDDNIYVVDGRSNRIKIFNSSGQLLLVFGDYYAVSASGKLAPGGFAIPVGIQIDITDQIFVVDQLNARIQTFQYLSDSYLAKKPIPAVSN